MQMLFYFYLKPQRFLYYLSITSGQITTDFMSLRHKTMYWLTPLWLAISAGFNQVVLPLVFPGVTLVTAVILCLTLFG